MQSKPCRNSVKTATLLLKLTLCHKVILVLSTNWRKLKNLSEVPSINRISKISWQHQKYPASIKLLKIMAFQDSCDLRIKALTWAQISYQLTKSSVLWRKSKKLSSGSSLMRAINMQRWRYLMQRNSRKLWQTMMSCGVWNLR